MKDYIYRNKLAWEEAFQKHKKGYKFDIAAKLSEKEYSFLNKDTLLELQKIEKQGKSAAQFCCNNGRELLSLMKLGFNSGIGFDIAENFVEEANRIAEKLNVNCKFINKNIYDINEEYKDKFDFLFISIGALCWFKDLSLFFKKVSMVLKKNGIVFINEQHPFTDILATKDEKEYDPDNPANIVFSYFRTDPWVESDGIDYIGGTKYKSKPFISFSHTLSEIFNSLITNKITITLFKEYDYDISNSFPNIKKSKLPLSYILIGEKHPNAI